jgi:seryl-tRNA synthetase
MTLDVLHFIDTKGGNADEIRDSQKKRGESVELVDEVIKMYGEWVKSASFLFYLPVSLAQCTLLISVDFNTNALRKEINAVQKEIAAKKKVCMRNFDISSIL